MKWLSISSNQFISSNFNKSFERYLQFQSSAEPNLLVLIRLSILTFWSFVQVFVFCDSSERLTGGFEEIDMYCLCDWYLFPMQVRRMLPTVIKSTQKPVIFEGYGNVMCTREMFKRVRPIYSRFINSCRYIDI